MMLFQARIKVPHNRVAEVLRSLRSIIDETRARPGCISCHLCIGAETENDSPVLTLIQGWSDLQSLKDHVRSDNFRVVLSALDYASEPPEVRFDSVSDTRGMGFILACRQTGAAT